MLKETFREVTESRIECQEMIIVLFVGPRYAEEWLPCDELKHKITKTPNIQRFIDRPKTE